MIKLFDTEDSVALTALRVGLGAIMFPHGTGKVFGWFGGPGFSGAMNLFTTQVHIPELLAVLVIAAEFCGSLGLLLGLLTRIAAFGIACTMVGAVLLVHLPHGFFMNWYGGQQGEGFEYHLLVIAMTIAIMIGGAGKWSFDRLLAKQS